MKVVISNMARSRVYHRCGCIYEKRITDANRILLEEKSAKKHKYRECKYCRGLHGYVRINKKKLAGKKKSDVMDYYYENHSDTLYLRTDVGFWKIFFKEDAGYLLYHLNRYEPEKKTEEMIHGYYHRQRDVKAEKSVDKILSYVEAHDRAKKIISDDYRKLPRSTKKQKKYYDIAKRRDRRIKMDRLNQLFAAIESEKRHKITYC